MNRYICYYCECTFEGTFEYTIPIESELSIKELENKISLNYEIVSGLPNYITKEEQEAIEIYTLEDWINRFKVII